MRALPFALMAASLALLSACSGESMQQRTQGSLLSPTSNVQTSQLKPGGLQPAPGMSNPFETTAWDVAEGKRLFEYFNCVGCHAHGGGAIGPPLMDKNWIYGSDPANVYASIVEGRPNGMPSFRGRINEFEVWRLVAYVRSLSGQVRKDVAPGRDDHMSVKKAESSTPYQKPTGTTGRPLPGETR